MSTRLITPPATLAVSVADAAVNLRIDEPELTYLAPLVTAWIAGVTEYAEHYMGRSIINQTWRVVLDCFSDAVRLDNCPVVSVTSVKFRDADGVMQTLDPQDYYMDNHSEPAYIVPAVGKSWPTTAAHLNSVEVEYVAGYGATPATVPPTVRAFILSKLTEQFDPSVRNESVQGGKAVQSSFLDKLLDVHKVYWL